MRRWWLVWVLASMLGSIVGRVRSAAIASPQDIIEILNSGYDKYLTPTQKSDHPTEIVIGFYVEGMSTVRAQTMDFHIDIYFEQRWVDERLRHNGSQRVLVKDPVILDRMWHPDLYFANANSAKFFDVTAPNFLLWIFPNGTVHHDLRISLTVLCNMDFTKYPLDSQECGIRILSYAYTVDQLVINWRETNPIVMNDQLKLPDMKLVGVESGYCHGEYTHGNWSCVRAEFHLRREKMHHFLQNYVPTILIVIISWFSFWLDVESVPGRVSLCITTLLTLATQASSARMALPQVSYAKAIDVWLEACLGFVFGVLIEFTIVNYLARSTSICYSSSSPSSTSRPMREPSMLDMVMLEERRTGGGGGVSNGMDTTLDARMTADGDNVVQMNENTAILERQVRPQWRRDEPSPQSIHYPYGVIGFKPYRKSNKNLANQIDRSCRLAFPLAFLIFNVAYWTYYLGFA